MRVPLTLSTPLVQRYISWIDAACDAIADVAGRSQALGLLLSLVWERLRRTMQRLDRLTRRWQAGARLTPRSRKPRPAKAAKPADPNRRPGRYEGVKLPRRNGWLLQLCQPAVYGMAGVQQMLEDPEIRALCEAAPQAGRLLRPLCRMYALALPEWLKLPPRPRKPKPAKPRPHPKFMHPDDHPMAARYFTKAQRSRLRRLGYVFKTEP